MKSTKFEKIDIPHKETSHISHNRYRVYRSEEDFVTVDADSAKAALTASGIEKPLRVERDTVIFHNVVNIHKPEETVAFVETPHGEPHAIVYEEPPAETAEAASEPPKASVPPEEKPAAEMSDAPLSKDDIDKLLQS